MLLIGNIVTVYAADYYNEKIACFTDNDGNRRTMTGETHALWYWGTDWASSGTRSESYYIEHSVSLFAYKNNKVQSGSVCQDTKFYSTGYYSALTTLNAKADKFVGKHWVSRTKYGTRIAYVETYDD